MAEVISPTLRLQGTRLLSNSMPQFSHTYGPGNFRLHLRSGHILMAESSAGRMQVLCVKFLCYCWTYPLIFLYINLHRIDYFYLFLVINYYLIIPIRIFLEKE